MELFLNLVWLAIAALMVWLWTRHASQDCKNRRTQLVALIVLILIIFPVISVTDDLMAAQNMAEARSAQREDYAYSNTHPALPYMLAIYSIIFLDSLHASSQFVTADVFPVPEIKASVIHPIDNRPPPVA